MLNLYREDILSQIWRRSGEKRQRKWLKHPRSTPSPPQGGGPAPHPPPSPCHRLLHGFSMSSRGSGGRSNGTLPQTKICQFKLVLLGDMAVGKSSLVLRFVKGQFDEFQETTIGGECGMCVGLQRASGDLKKRMLTCHSPLTSFISSRVPGSVGVSRWHHSKVWDLGHRRTGAIPQPGSHVLPRRSGRHCRLWHHQAGILHYITCHLADAFIQSDLQ